MDPKKPEYLYHGSPYLVEKLIPRPASGEKEKESLTAIYAAETIKDVIPFALPVRWYPDTPEGRRDFKCSNGRTELIYGSLNPGGRGYVYKVKADNFVKIDHWQWISESAVIPEEIIEIRVEDYWDTISFSEAAEKIQRRLFPQFYSSGEPG